MYIFFHNEFSTLFQGIISEQMMHNHSYFNLVGHILLNGSSNETETYYAYQDFPSVPDEPLFHLLIELHKYGLPIVFTIGVFLNILTGLIISKTELIKVTPFVYFMAFTVVDSIYLVAKIVPWASMRGTFSTKWIAILSGICCIEENIVAFT
jgi:hypothetical protein